MTREAWDRECKRRVRNLVFGQPMKAGVTAAPPMSPDIAIVAAQSSMSRDFGPRPPKAETGKGPGLLRLAWGFLFKREETMDARVLKPFKKSVQAVLVGVISLVAGYFLSPDFADAVKDLPLVDMWGAVAGAALSGAIMNIAQHLKEYKPKPKQ